MGEILEHYENSEDGVESFVIRGRDAFNVCLKDTDAGEFVGVALIYKDREKASSKAREIVA